MIWGEMWLLEKDGFGDLKDLNPRLYAALTARFGKGGVNWIRSGDLYQSDRPYLIELHLQAMEEGRNSPLGANSKTDIILCDKTGKLPVTVFEHPNVAQVWTIKQETVNEEPLFTLEMIKP